MLKSLLIIIGTLSLGLGILGILVPGLPTTPFLLLTAGLYARSSPRLHRWMLNHPTIGRYIKKYRENGGMTKRQKIYSITLMWLMISISAIFFIISPEGRVAVVAAGIIGTVVMGWIVPDGSS